MAPYEVAPLVESGLHCGDWYPCPSSRLAKSPRSSRAGSIAAVPILYTKTRRNGRPARRERAPLRPGIRPGCLAVVGASPRSSRAGSIAAPPRPPPAASCGPVAPLVESGLHCGGTALHSFTRRLDVAPLVESGLHCGGFRHARASGASRVAPLVESGLHCGPRAGERSGEASWVAPLVESGLHCGDAVLAVGLVVGAGRPARRERAPLRRLAER